MNPCRREYSAFEHYAQAVLVSRWKEGYWLMLTVGTTAYFDESRIDPSHNVAVVAGFVASTDMWSGLDKKWKRLMEDKPPKLHWKKYVQQECVAFAKLART